MRIALHSTLNAGSADDYLREHARVPDELRALFDRAGIRDWTIWRSGDHLFHVVDCDDFDAAMRVIRDDDADRRWQAHIGRFIEGFVGPDGEPGYLPLRPVWQLEHQRAADRAAGGDDGRSRGEDAAALDEPDMGLD